MIKVGASLLFIDSENSAWEFKDKFAKKIKDSIVDVAISGDCDLLLLDSEGVVWQQSKSATFDRIPELPEIKSIHGGENGCILLDSNGFVWCSEAADYGNRGLIYSPETFIKNSFLSNIVSAAVSKHHFLFLTEEGRVWGYGYNCEGQLGLGEERSGFQREPALIENLPVIDKIAAGYHSMFLDLEGNVWVCGWNNYGELGLKHTQTVYEPTRVADLPAIVDISAGYLHSLFLDVDGKVWSSGLNSSGQLGREDKLKSLETIEGIPPINAIEGAEYSSYFIDQDDRLWMCGDANSAAFQPVLVEGFSSKIMPRNQRRRKQAKSARNVASATG